MIRKCDICGTEADEHKMESYNIGAKTIWLCWDCYKQSQYEVAKSEISRRTKLAKMNESKKRNK
jgi:ribosome-binding protein aMBF1 (putative translation factor)